jgi:hypothetical protein
MVGHSENVPSADWRFTDFRYKHVVAALAEVMMVTEEEMGAFRARLRHLRNSGIPAIPRPGKGTHISYKFRDILHILFALQLEELGHSPGRAASATVSEIAKIPPNILDPSLSTGDTYVLIYVNWHKYPEGVLSEAGAICYGFDELVDHLRNSNVTPAFTMVNMSQCARDLMNALSRALNTA